MDHQGSPQILFLMEIIIVSAVFLLLRSCVDFWLPEYWPHFGGKKQECMGWGNKILLSEHIKCTCQSRDHHWWPDLSNPWIITSLFCLFLVYHLSWLQARQHTRGTEVTLYVAWNVHLEPAPLGKLHVQSPAVVINWFVPVKAAKETLENDRGSRLSWKKAGMNINSEEGTQKSLSPSTVFISN